MFVGSAAGRLVLTGFATNGHGIDDHGCRMIWGRRVRRRRGRSAPSPEKKPTQKVEGLEEEDATSGEAWGRSPHRQATGSTRSMSSSIHQVTCATRCQDIVPPGCVVTTPMSSSMRYSRTGEWKKGDGRGGGTDW